MTDQDIQDIIIIGNRIEDLTAKKVNNLLEECGKRVEDTLIVTDRVENKIRGIIITTIENIDNEDVAFIQLCVSNKKGNVNTMLDVVIDWAKNIQNVNKLYFMSKRNPKAWEKKYKFKEVYKVMKRSI